MPEIRLEHEKIDCGKEVKQYSNKFSLDLSILDKFKAALGIDPQKLIEISEHGFMALRNMQAYCRLYNADPKFTLKEYLRRIDQSQAYLAKVGELSAKASLGDHRHEPAPTRIQSWGGGINLNGLEWPSVAELPSIEKILSQLHELGKSLSEVKESTRLR